VIRVDSRLPLEQQREKIAHELGHLILHVGIQPDLPELFVVSQEFQTNHFAEHLLVPYYMFDHLAYKASIFEAPKLISHLFKVSERLA
ncbi:ImmA/IrrE family metallo-endopeptidase, partial [Burkholderia sp. SIMBA_043]